LRKAKIDPLTGEPRVPMYIRIRPSVRLRFKAVAAASGETMEKRAERLFLEDIRRNRKLLSGVAAN